MDMLNFAEFVKIKSVIVQLIPLQDSKGLLALSSDKADSVITYLFLAMAF